MPVMVMPRAAASSPRRAAGMRGALARALMPCSSRRGMTRRAAALMVVRSAPRIWPSVSEVRPSRWRQAAAATMALNGSFQGAGREWTHGDLQAGPAASRASWSFQSRTGSRWSPRRRR